MNIGFDADGVIFDTELFQLSAQVVKFMKEKYGLEVVNENGYRIRDIFGCSDKIEMEFWTKFVIQYSIFFKARPFFSEMIKELKAQGNKIYIITSKACSLEKNYKGIAVRFLFELGLKLNGINVDGIEYCSLENSAESKLAACRKLNIDVMVEDYIENIEYLAQYIPIICVETKNNQNIRLSNVLTAKDTNDIYAHIQRIISQKNKSQNIFSICELKSKEEKENMDVEERIKYYALLLEYYKNLPYNDKKTLRSEKIIRIIAKIYSIYFERKYNPIVIGRENIPKEKGNIYICNHLCDKDMLFLLSELKTELEQWHPLIKEEILGELSGLLFKVGDAVFVNRKNAKSRHISTQEMAKKIVHGYNVLIFPEGTYNKTGAALKDFTGTSHVYLSQMLQRPIVPMAITKDYTQSPILRIGEPYIVDKYIALDAAQYESYRKLENLVEENRKLTLRMKGN